MNSSSFINDLGEICVMSCLQISISFGCYYHIHVYDHNTSISIIWLKKLFILFLKLLDITRTSWSNSPTPSIIIKFFHWVVIPLSLCTNNDDNNGSRIPTLNRTLNRASKFPKCVEKHKNQLKLEFEN